MKRIQKITLLLLAVCLASALLLTGCTGGSGAGEGTTNAPTTEAPSGEATPSPDTNNGTVTDAETEPETEAETEAETSAPADLSADELKALLSAALEKEVKDVSVSVKAFMDGEVYSENVLTRIGNTFLVENITLGMTERVIALEDKVYYYVAMSDGTTDTELRYVLTPTAEEREELAELYVDSDSFVGMEDPELVRGLVNSTLAGQRYADGSVEMTCTELDASLVEILMGESMDGSTLTFRFTLDGEGRMTFMRFTVVLPAELTGGVAMTVSSDTVLNYAPAALAAPADADVYAEASYDDLFGFQLPELDPDTAVFMGLDPDGDNYTIGGETPAVDPTAQMNFLYVFAPYYEGKSFTVYGNVIEDEGGHIRIAVGAEDMSFAVYFDGVSEPVVGSYVKVTATLTRTVDMGDYADFDCFTLMATACETLGEAKGPNGGKLMYITASALNVRSEPDSSKENKVGLLYNGDMVEVLETGLGGNKNWAKIVFDCDQGYAYISMTYISETKP